MESITLLLGQVREGNAEARSNLFTQVYSELTRLAHVKLAVSQQRHLDAPSLVHEAYLRLSEQQLVSLQDRQHFFAYAATVMRNVIIDVVRHQRAQKRGAGAVEVTLSGVDAKLPDKALDAEELHSAMESLAQIDQRAFRVVEMRYFAGLSVGEIAEELNVSEKTVERSWRSARAYLFSQLRD